MGDSDPDRAARALIRDRSLPREFADSLNQYVRAKFLDLWEAARLGRDDEY